jgi:hypothetical protein
VDDPVSQVCDASGTRNWKKRIGFQNAIDSFADDFQVALNGFFRF